MFAKERPLPKALNIIRPAPPPFPNQHDSLSSSTASSPSEISTISNFSTFSNSRPQPTIFNPASLFQSNINTFKSPASTVGINPQRFYQRPRSNSNLSRSTFFSAFSDHHNNTNTDNEEEDELDSIDGLTDEEEEEVEEDDDEEEEDIKVVAKVKHGTIMNGKGEFVNKGNNHEHWLEEARANRKVADLEIENQNLLQLNASLEAKLRQQASRIAELEKKLQQGTEAPLTPISDKHVEDEDDRDETALLYNKELAEEEAEADKAFHQIRSALEQLIVQAESALIQKSKQSGKVLQDYTYQKEDEEILQKLSIRSSSPTELKKRPSTRRVSDSSTKPLPRPSSVKMSRNISRQSSPPVLQRSASPSYLQRSASPSYLQRSASPSLSQRTASPSIQHRPSSRQSVRKQSQDMGKPKWHN
ncbi:uncharacterized protein RHIMIDRAFT_291291 [Rhizopus microsporus ATCC 52813]|uniref:Uncharacterized protein n=2 Tax=Rhizopus TaxID=4842 RepID=A0A2G4SXY0_RHIZD|nr:uncharacterized protein RHIMIDRAFT_291291 [Rhizopus microsporus ATCC 52813]PHZ13612.1 hypothetical protein RHIMIDRAFT_291291 [Rhizopus microsporus ATCC 52813]